MIDEISTNTIPENVKLFPIAMVHDKQIFLIRAREEDVKNQKSYVRALIIMMGNELVTTNYADTKLLMSEFKLFDKGNKQNKFTTVEKHNGDVNLMLKLSSGPMYISRAESHTITDVFNDAKSGVSIQRLLEFELKFTAETLVRFLSNAGLLDKEKK